MKRFFFLFFIICVNYVFSQKETGFSKYEVNKIYTQSFIDSLTYDYASGQNKIPFKNKAIKQVLENNRHLKGWMRYYIGEAASKFRKSKLDSANFYLKKAFNIFEKGDENSSLYEHLLIRAYVLKSAFLVKNKQYDSVIVTSQRALKLTKKYPFRWKGYIIRYIADAHISLGNTDFAKQYFEKTLQDSVYMSYPSNLIEVHTRIGNVFQEKDNSKKAIEHYNIAIQSSIKSSYKDNLPGLFGNVGFMYNKLGNIDSTSLYFKKSIEAYKKYKLKGLYEGIDEYNLFYQAFLNEQNSDYRLVANQLKEIIEKISKYEVIETDERELLKEIYAMNNRIPIRYVNNEVLETVFDLYSKSYNDQLKANLERLEIKYKTKEKDKSIEHLEAINNRQATILSQKNIINWSLAGIFLLSIVVVILIVIRRKQQEKFRLMSLEQRLLRSQLNPHFLFNTLNTASILAHQKSAKAVTYISKLGILLRLVLESSREEFISLASELEILTSYIDFESNFSQRFQYAVNISTSLDQEEVLVPPMFIQPLIENAIKHGFKGSADDRLSIHISVEDSKRMKVRVKNSGIKYSEKDKNKSHTSLSGAILKERLMIYSKQFKTQLNYEIQDVSENDFEGSLAQIFIPYILDQ